MPQEKFAFIHKPKIFKPELEVIACYLALKDGRVLFLRQEKGEWSIIVGEKEKKEKGDINDLMRIIRKQTGLNLEKYRSSFTYCNEFFIKYEKIDFIYRSYIVVLPTELSPRITLSTRHNKLDWFKPSDAASSLQLVRGLKEIISYEKKLL